MTGWGKHSKVAGDSVVKREVEAQLVDLESPFRVCRDNGGRFVAPGTLVGSWLALSATQGRLVLKDVRAANGVEGVAEGPGRMGGREGKRYSERNGRADLVAC